MLRYLLVCLTVSFFGTVSGQEIIHREHIGWSGGDVEMHTFSDKPGYLRCTVLANDDSIRLFLSDPSDYLGKEFNISRAQGEEILGGFIDQHKIYLFCGYKNPRGFHNYVFNIDDGTFTQNLVISEGKKGNVIDRISAGDCFMVFSINKKTSEFTISRWSIPDSADIITYAVNDKDIWDEITVSSGFSRDIKISKVDEPGLPDVSVVGSQRKLYLVHDTIFLLLNSNKGNTKVFAFDTRRKSFFSRFITNEALRIVMNDKELDKNSPIEYVSSYSGYTDNSFLLDGKLYFASASSDRLHISIMDFYSGAELKKFSVNRDDSIPFKNTPVIQEGQLYGFGVKKELTKTKQLLRKMTAGNAVIAALKDSLGVGLTIGSNKEMQQMGSGGSFVPMGSTPGAMMYMPSGGFSRSTWTKSVRFRMLIDSSSLNYIPGEMEPSINDRIETFTRDIKIPNNAENLLFHDGKYLYIYYDKKERSLVYCHFNY
jgi:hypothetical protein